MFNDNNFFSGGAAEFYDHPIEQSLRFNDDDSAYLSWTPSSAGNRKTWTWSGWVKRGNLGGMGIFSCNAGNTNNSTYFRINFGDAIQVWLQSDAVFITSSVYRDTSAWYHIVLAVDTTQAAASDRYKLYVNGEQVTSFSYDNRTLVAQNTDLAINSTSSHKIGHADFSSYLDGYLAEVHFIDGTALDASSFGETKSGVWIPKAYSGTYGTNGFYLPFNHDYSVEGFSATTYTGTGSDLYVGGVGFQPDLLWIKQRNGGIYNHQLFDSIRGADQALLPNTTTAEADYNSHKSFDPDGFTVQNALGVNSSGGTYVAWCWDAGSGSPVSNTDGSITSTVKASTDYGFSIATYTGTGSLATVGHGLSSAPEMILIKSRSNIENWQVYHTSLGNTKYMEFTTAAAATNSNRWNNTSPTSSVTTINTHAGLNNSGWTYVMYSFHSVSGYSKIGSYTGTGSSGNSVTTGFKPAFVMVKRTDSTGQWYMVDSVRGADRQLAAESSSAELGFTGEFTDTGFVVGGSNAGYNGSGGTYIYMAFADKREAAFWLDQSGNNNDFENNNLTESDISLDSPTNNFATLNPLDDEFTTSEGNLKATQSTSNWFNGRSTFSVSSGKWYFESVQINTSGLGCFGVRRPSNVLGDGYIGDRTGDAGLNFGSGTIYKNNATTNTLISGVSDAVGNILQCALDMDNGKIWFGLNGTWLQSGDPSTDTNPMYTGLADELSPAISVYNSRIQVLNFGQDSSFAGNKTAQGNTDANGYGDFYYAPPTGYLALCTANLEVPDAMNPALDNSPQDHFNTVLYTGDGTTSRSITGVGFAPDAVWMKRRNGAYNHTFGNSVVGATKYLSTNTTDAEITSGWSSFDSDGFSLNSAGPAWNASGATFAAWNWKANGSGVSNTDGSITSTVSANTDAGFSIVSYTTTTDASDTVGHGLSSAPEFIITKDRDNAIDWFVFTDVIDGSIDTLKLNLTNAKVDQGGSPAFSATTFTTNYGVARNTIAYCFHSVSGFSKFGSYTGNGSTDNAFVYTGFAPAFVIIKKDGDGNNWLTHDIYRDTTNQNDVVLFPNSSSAEATNTGYGMDMLSNGFKIRASGGEIGSSGGTYIFMAFSSNPFKYSTAV